MSDVERLVFGGGAWGGDPTDLPSLSIEVQDGDIATVDYRPAPDGLGRFYLGFQPRDLFDDPAESAPVDLDAEAEAFAEWALLVGAVDVEAKHVRRLLAEEHVEEPQDTFVEETVQRLVRLVGLPVPDGLEGGGDLL
ncbi:hypothetical protein [Cellulomonas soli]|uniref:Uncharacterized protein n=1 Tax=Cellulomonas soli TaxID=931535 RepID=A0A512PC45_9CELL|nr:hypothetical protein [Cellulomonas soli]NYI58356.1 hypothetical protein [Cellulomonas soli]GEP68777.1 hypothetical protein CSO01_14920 [Cellulomonas soli]